MTRQIEIDITTENKVYRTFKTPKWKKDSGKCRPAWEVKAETR